MNNTDKETEVGKKLVNLVICEIEQSSNKLNERQLARGIDMCVEAGIEVDDIYNACGENLDLNKCLVWSYGYHIEDTQEKYLGSFKNTFLTMKKCQELSDECSKQDLDALMEIVGGKWSSELYKGQHEDQKIHAEIADGRRAPSGYLGLIDSGVIKPFGPID
jgi:hypothetical protein